MLESVGNSAREIHVSLPRSPSWLVGAAQSQELPARRHSIVTEPDSPNASNVDRNGFSSSQSRAEQSAFRQSASENQICLNACLRDLTI